LALAIYFVVTAIWVPGISYREPLIYWGVDLLRFWIVPFGMLYFGYRLNGGHIARRPSVLREQQLSDAKRLARFAGGLLCCYLSVALGSTLGAPIFGTILHALFGIPYAPDGLVKVQSRYTGPERVMVVFYLSLTAGVLEEIFYRGVADRLASTMKQAWANRTIYYLIGVGLFSAYHWPSGAYTMGLAIGLGWAACIFYRATGMLSIVILAHFLFDFYVLV
jgi:membrane protease YdiL (CAAX protease family)